MSRKVTTIPVGDLTEEERQKALDVYVRTRTDAQLARYDEPAPGLFVAESIIVIGRAMDAGYKAESFLIDEKLCGPEMEELIGRAGDVPVYASTGEELKKLLGFVMPRGILCAMRRKELPGVEEVCEGARRIAVLEDVENPTNVGAIFRSAAALDMDAVLLTPTCCDPLNRRAVRVSMGTVFQVPWARLSDWPAGGLAKLSAHGFRTCAMALTDASIPIDAPSLAAERRLAIVLGAEGDGLAADTIARCDYTVRIPMAHGVDSLNVAAASAVAFWQLRAQREG